MMLVSRVMAVKATPEAVRASPAAGQSRSADVEDALQRVIHHADNAEHDKEIQQHGHAAGRGAYSQSPAAASSALPAAFRACPCTWSGSPSIMGWKADIFAMLFCWLGLQGDLDDVDEQGEEDDVPAVARQQLVDPLHDIAERTAQDVKEVHTFVHSAPAVARDALFFYRRTRRPQCSASQEAKTLSPMPLFKQLCRL